MLPSGELFIAGPQKPARRFDPSAATITDDPAKRYNQISSQRGVNMDGTAVLPLKPPHYEPRVLILGGSAPDAQQTAEWIDLSVATPVWQALPNLNVPHDKVNSVKSWLRAALRRSPTAVRQKSSTHKIRRPASSLGRT